MSFANLEGSDAVRSVVGVTPLRTPWFGPQQFCKREELSPTDNESKECIATIVSFDVEFCSSFARQRHAEFDNWALSLLSSLTFASLSNKQNSRPLVFCSDLLCRDSKNLGPDYSNGKKQITKLITGIGGTLSWFSSYDELDKLCRQFLVSHLYQWCPHLEEPFLLCPSSSDEQKPPRMLPQNTFCLPCLVLSPPTINGGGVDAHSLCRRLEVEGSHLPVETTNQWSRIALPSHFRTWTSPLLCLHKWLSVFFAESFDGQSDSSFISLSENPETLKSKIAKFCHSALSAQDGTTGMWEDVYNSCLQNWFPKNPKLTSCKVREEPANISLATAEEAKKPKPPTQQLQTQAPSSYPYLALPLHYNIHNNNNKIKSKFKRRIIGILGPINLGHVKDALIRVLKEDSETTLLFWNGGNKRGQGLLASKKISDPQAATNTIGPDPSLQCQSCLQVQRRVRNDMLFLEEDCATQLLPANWKSRTIGMNPIKKNQKWTSSKETKRDDEQADQGADDDSWLFNFYRAYICFLLSCDLIVYGNCVGQEWNALLVDAAIHQTPIFLPTSTPACDDHSFLNTNLAQALPNQSLLCLPPLRSYWQKLNQCVRLDGSFFAQRAKTIPSYWFYHNASELNQLMQWKSIIPWSGSRGMSIITSSSFWSRSEHSRFHLPVVTPRLPPPNYNHDHEKKNANKLNTTICFIVSDSLMMNYGKNLQDDRQKWIALNVQRILDVYKSVFTKLGWLCSEMSLSEAHQKWVVDAKSNKKRITTPLFAFCGNWLEAEDNPFYFFWSQVCNSSHQHSNVKYANKPYLLINIYSLPALLSPSSDQVALPSVTQTKSTPTSSTGTAMMQLWKQNPILRNALSILDYASFNTNIWQNLFEKIAETTSVVTETSRPTTEDKLQQQSQQQPQPQPQPQPQQESEALYKTNFQTDQSELKDHTHPSYCKFGVKGFKTLNSIPSLVQIDLCVADLSQAQQNVIDNHSLGSPSDTPSFAPSTLPINKDPPQALELVIMQTQSSQFYSALEVVQLVNDLAVGGNIYVASERHFLDNFPQLSRFVTLLKSNRDDECKINGGRQHAPSLFRRLGVEWSRPPLCKINEALPPVHDNENNKHDSHQRNKDYYEIRTLCDLDPTILNLLSRRFIEYSKEKTQIPCPFESGMLSIETSHPANASLLHFFLNVSSRDTHACIDGQRDHGHSRAGTEMPTSQLNLGSANFKSEFNKDMSNLQDLKCISTCENTGLGVTTPTPHLADWEWSGQRFPGHAHPSENTSVAPNPFVGKQDNSKLGLGVTAPPPVCEMRSGRSHAHPYSKLQEEEQAREMKKQSNSPLVGNCVPMSSLPLPIQVVLNSFLQQQQQQVLLFSQAQPQDEVVSSSSLRPSSIELSGTILMNEHGHILSHTENAPVWNNNTPLGMDADAMTRSTAYTGTTPRAPTEIEATNPSLLGLSVIAPPPVYDMRSGCNGFQLATVGASLNSQAANNENQNILNLIESLR